MSILQEAQAILPEIVGWRRYFHQHPELGMDLPVTAAKVKEVLDSLGVSSIRIKKYREVKNFCRPHPAGPRRIGLAQSSGKSTLPTKE